MDNWIFTVAKDVTCGDKTRCSAINFRDVIVDFIFIYLAKGERSKRVDRQRINNAPNNDKLPSNGPQYSGIIIFQRLYSFRNLRKQSIF